MAASAAKTMLGALGRKINGPIVSAGTSGKALGAIGAVAFGAGVMNKTGPAAMDATMEGAFGDENADRYFTGRDLSLRTFAGASIGGLGGEMLQMTDQGDYLAINPIMPPNALVSSASGAAAGTGLGALAGSAIAKHKGKGGIKGAVLGGIIGNVAGGMLGAAGSASTPLMHMRNNQEFFSESPYSPLGRGNNILNASGNIVLGMHNSRRGY